MKYSVRYENTIVFESDSKLECEYTAIALALASHYTEPKVLHIYRDKTCIDEVDTTSSAMRMEQKLRGLRFNKRVPDEITIEDVDSFILYKLGKNKDKESIKERIDNADIFKDDLRKSLPT